MCGRFTLRAPASQIAEQFALFDSAEFRARYNIAPTQDVAAVRVRPDVAAGRRHLAWLRWGLIPSWAKDAAIGNRMINARAETVAEKPAFRTPLARRRCLVLADGFYEWQKAGTKKQPYFIRMADERPFAFAGLWESWEGPDHALVESCTIITTEANALVRPVHDRMPVILARDDYERWLDPAVRDAAALVPLLRPYPAEAMSATPVSAFVNSPAHDGPQCIEPAA
jgi:putative SOS response-associated peptidase YedK